LGIEILLAMEIVVWGKCQAGWLDLVDGNGTAGKTELMTWHDFGWVNRRVENMS
jgi:hypothetical protein